MRNFRFMSGVFMGCLITLLHLQGYGQNTIVKLDFGTPTAEDPIPFDEPFLVKGPVGKDVVKVIFSYKIDPGDKKDWHYWLGGPAVAADGIWERQDDSDHFIFKCGPLHPNARYELSFKMIKKITLEGEKRKELNEKLVKQIRVFFSQSNIDPEKITALAKNLTGAVRQLIDDQKKIINADGTDFSVDAFVGGLADATKKIGDLVAADSTDSTAAVGFARGNELLNATKLATRKSIEATLLSILDGKIKLGEAAKKLLELPVDPSSKDFAAWDGNDFLSFWAVALEDMDNLKDLLQGSLKIEGKYLVPSNTRHLPSIRLLSAFVGTIRHKRFVTSAGKPVFSNPELTMLEESQKGLRMLIARQEQYISGKAALKLMAANFPDVLIGAFIQEQFLFTESPKVDIESEKNNYVGLDVGFVFAPDIKSVFTYQGLNFYLVPVNKKAPFSRFEKRDIYLKRLSFYLGITQNLTKSNFKRYENLIDGTGSVLVGAGFRITRQLRLNAGGMVYFLKDANPIVDDSKLKLTPTVSLSLDINVSKAFGDLLGVLKPS